MKIKTDKADKMFSLYIRTRDKWTCRRCRRKHEEGSRGLHCSHYFGRGKETVRFDPRNCDALCFACHNLWGHGDERDRYTEFKKKQLGENEFKILEMEAYRTGKKDRKTAYLVARQLYEDLLKTQ